MLQPFGFMNRFGSASLQQASTQIHGNDLGLKTETMTIPMDCNLVSFIQIGQWW